MITSAYSYVCTLGVTVAILKMLHISFDFDPKTMVIIILSNYLFFQKKWRRIAFPIVYIDITESVGGLNSRFDVLL